MLSVLIADDEFIEREGISLLLGQSPYEFRIYMAGNGEEAMRCLEENDIDILFTDIKMPFMDGLELLIQANRKFRGLKIVIFSAFADFNYAKTALENKVLHYFLKPVDPDEFQEVLAEVVEAAMEEESKLKRYWEGGGADGINSFLTQKGPAPEELEQLFHGWEACSPQLFDLQDETETAIAAFFNGLEERFGENARCICVSEGIFLLLQKSGPFAEKSRRETEITEYFMHCGIRQACVILGGHGIKLEALPEEYHKMEEMLRFHFFVDGNQIFYAEEGVGESGKAELIIGRIVNEICHGIENGNLSYVEENLVLLRKELRSHISNSQIYVKYLYANLLKKLLEKAEEKGRPEGGDKVFKEYLDQLFYENSLSGIHNFMLTLAGQLIPSAASENKSSSEQKRVIRSVMKIVEERYQEDISLQSIAEEVYLSPSYLSYLFKKEVGVSLIKYITMIRLDKAKELLRSGNMKVSDIAASVGYQNYSYFNIAFKNNVGESPAQYREHAE